jgi:hypothetical protein
MVDRGLRLYGALNVCFAAFYCWIAYDLAPDRRPLFPLAVGLCASLLALSGVGLLLRARFARRLALAACWFLLAGCAAIVIALVLSSAYLRGVYGGFGKGAAVVSLLFAALVVELAGLLPIFEIRFLSRPEVRSALGG